MEKYSVLMSLYRKEDPAYLREALGSMLSQTAPPDEIVLVEDGPLTEELYAVVSAYSDKAPGLFTIIVNEENIGLGASLNRGLSACRNELIARMDTDDISKPSRCEKQLRRFEEEPDLDILGTWVEEFEKDPADVISVRAVPETHEEIYEFSKRRSPFNHPTVMYRKSSVLNCGVYSQLRRNQDVELFGRMLHMGCRAANIPEARLSFRCGGDLEKRRKSWENTSTYIGAVNTLRKMGHSSLKDCLAVSAAQLAVFLMPLPLQRFVYKKFLRK
jgi:glycosyltransferase involved in cell wall biosynthesis